jgi:hypothetical protein
MLIIMGIGHGFVHVIFAQTKTDRCHAYVIHSAMLFFLLRVPEWLSVYWQIALYSYVSSHLAL